MKLLTNLIFEPKGTHDPALAYSIKDTVMSADGSRVYFALQDVPAGVALSNADYWKLQIDLSGSKNAMDEAKNAIDKAIASFGDSAKEIGLRVRGETAVATGSPVTFLPDAGSLLQPVTVLEPRQEGKGDPSPDNIRPFIGYDKLNLTATGKNLLQNAAKTETKNTITFTVNADGSVTANGTNPQQYSFTYTLNDVALPIGKYILTGTPVGFWITIRLTYSDGRMIYHGDNGSGLTFTITSDVQSVWVYIDTKENATYNNTVFRPMLRLASDTDATYEPYVGKTYTAQLGQTVYGIRYEWLTGKAWIEWAMREFDGTENWKAAPTAISGKYRLQLDGLSPAPQLPGSIYVAAAMQCSHYKTVTSSNTWNGVTGASFEAGINSLLIYDPVFSDYTTPDKWKANLAAQKAAGTPVQIAYKLATPIEIPLTPHIISAADPEQINTLYGDGTIEAEYVKPLHVSIEEHVAAALAATAE